MKKLSRKRKFFYGLGVACVVVVLLLAAAEGTVRAYIHFKYGVQGKTYGLWRHDDVLGAQHRENAYGTRAQTNDFGFRGTENVFQPKPDGALRVIAYGGSTTFCYNLKDEEAWPIRLQELLRASHHPKDQVLNGGAIMWSIGHALARARKDLPVLKPDWVLVYAGVNEVANVVGLREEGIELSEEVAKGHYGLFTKRLDQNRWLKRNVALVRVWDYFVLPLLRSTQKFKEEFAPAVPKPDPAILENYRHVVADFAALCKANGARCVVIKEAYWGKDKSTTEWLEYLTSYSREGADAAVAEGAIVVDAQPVVTGFEGDRTTLFSDSGVHLSEEGARRFARLVHDQVFAPGASGAGGK